MPPPLAAEGLVATRGGRRVLDDASLTVDAGARHLVRGASGAGKTTLFELLALLDVPEEGRVVVDGVDATTHTPTDRARLRRDHLGVVFQEFRLVPELTARENAALPQDHAGDRDDAWLDTLLDRLALREVADRAPAALSGGEKQRVAIARALANRPEVVLADEPTGQLDPGTTDAVLELLLDLQADTGAALVVVSHDPRLADAFDSVSQLRDGRLRPG